MIHEADWIGSPLDPGNYVRGVSRQLRGHYKGIIPGHQRVYGSSHSNSSMRARVLVYISNFRICQTLHVAQIWAMKRFLLIPLVSVMINSISICEYM